MPSDYDTLRALELSPDLLWRFRSRGATPAPEEWTRLRSSGVLAEFLVVRRASSQPIGAVFAYNASPMHGFAYIGAGNFNPARSSPLFLLGAAMFVEYLFRTWPLRKLYAEMGEYNYERFRSGSGRMFKLEGCLRQHHYLDGHYWDEYLLALYREDWEAGSQRFLKIALGVEI